MHKQHEYIEALNLLRQQWNVVNMKADSNKKFEQLMKIESWIDSVQTELNIMDEQEAQKQAV